MFDTPRASKRRKLSDPATDGVREEEMPEEPVSTGTRRSERSTKGVDLRVTVNGATPQAPTRSRRDLHIQDGRRSSIRTKDGVEVAERVSATRNTRSGRRKKLEAVPNQLDDRERPHEGNARGEESIMPEDEVDRALGKDNSESKSRRRKGLISSPVVASSAATEKADRRSARVGDHRARTPVNGKEEPSNLSPDEIASIDPDSPALQDGTDKAEDGGNPNDTPASAKAAKLVTRSKRRRGNRTDNFENAHSPEPTSSSRRIFKDTEMTGLPRKTSVPPLDASPQALGPTARLDSSSHPEEIKILRNIVLSKLTSRRPIALQNLTPEHTKVHSLLKATVSAGEGNSMLVLGARGTGKSAIVNDALSSLDSDPTLRDTFHVIKLDGFIQTDDKLALREIWRQLGREMELDDGEEGAGTGPQSKNYADALSTLLALLSHPSEHRQHDDTEHAPTNEDGNDAASRTLTTKSIIFIMDEFDLFAARPRQTLLYNLFDVAQARKAPIAVLGLSTRMDVAEMLEKRVKSRFSHRFVFVPQAKSLTAFLGTLKAALRIDARDLGEVERRALAACIEAGPDGDWEEVVDNAMASWNSATETLLTQPSTTLDTLTRIYHTTKSIPAAMSALYLPVYHLDPSSFSPTSQAQAQPLPQRSHLQPPPLPPLHLLPSLPSLPLSLLISALRLPHLTNSPQTINFHLAYAEYVRLASAARLASTLHAKAAGGIAGRVWGREVSRGAWEGLVRCGLLSVVGAGAAGGGRGGVVTETWMVRAEVALEEIEGAVGRGMDGVLRRWCREL